MKNNLGYDSLNIDSDIYDALEKYRFKSEEFEKWLEASLIVQGNLGDIDYQTSFFLFEVPNVRPKVELVLNIADGSQGYFDSRHGDVDIDFLSVRLLEVKESRFTADIVLDYIKANPGATKNQIAKALNMKANYAVHNVLAEICYRKHLVEEVSGPETGYRVVDGERQEIAYIFRNANKQQKFQMLLNEKDVYKVRDMLKTLLGGPSSPAFNLADNLSDLFPNMTWPEPVVKAKNILAEEQGRMWSYAGD